MNRSTKSIETHDTVQLRQNLPEGLDASFRSKFSAHDRYSRARISRSQQKAKSEIESWASDGMKGHVHLLTNSGFLASNVIEDRALEGKLWALARERHSYLRYQDRERVLLLDRIRRRNNGGPLGDMVRDMEMGKTPRRIRSKTAPVENKLAVYSQSSGEDVDGDTLNSSDEDDENVRQFLKSFSYAPKSDVPKINSRNRYYSVVNNRRYTRVSRDNARNSIAASTNEDLKRNSPTASRSSAMILRNNRPSTSPNVDRRYTINVSKSSNPLRDGIPRDTSKARLSEENYSNLVSIGNSVEKNPENKIRENVELVKNRTSEDPNLGLTSSGEIGNERVTRDNNSKCDSDAAMLHLSNAENFAEKRKLTNLSEIAGDDSKTRNITKKKSLDIESFVLTNNDGSHETQRMARNPLDNTDYVENNKIRKRRTATDLYGVDNKLTTRSKVSRKKETESANKRESTNHGHDSRKVDFEHHYNHNSSKHNNENTACSQTVANEADYSDNNARSLRGAGGSSCDINSEIDEKNNDSSDKSESNEADKAMKSRNSRAATTGAGGDNSRITSSAGIRASHSLSRANLTQSRRLSRPRPFTAPVGPKPIHAIPLELIQRYPGRKFHPIQLNAPLAKPPASNAKTKSTNNKLMSQTGFDNASSESDNMTSPVTMEILMTHTRGSRDIGMTSGNEIGLWEESRERNREHQTVTSIIAGIDSLHFTALQEERRKKLRQAQITEHLIRKMFNLP